MGESCRVLLVGPDYERTPGGMATVTKSLLEDRNLRERGVRLAFVASHQEGSAATKLLVLARALARTAVLVPHADVVHLQVATGASVWRKLIFAGMATSLGCPVVVHLHGAELEEEYVGGPAAQRLAYRALFRTASVVAALGTPTAHFLEQHFPQTRVAVIPNFVRAGDTAAPPSDTGSVLFLGRLCRRKGVYDLLEALELLGREQELPLVVLAGDGDVEQVRGIVERSEPLRGSVSVPGWLDGEAAHRAVADATFVVLPSYAEGLPMSLLEAMAEARPVIATDVGSVADAVVDGETGYVVPPGDHRALADAMRALLTAGAAQEMGRRAQERVRSSFSAEAVADKLEGTYREVVAAHA